MKTVFTILMVLATLVTQPTQQEEFVVEATYLGMEDEGYIFTEDDGSEYAFSTIDTKASQKYDLSADQYLGKKFEVTYWIETEIDENDEEYDVYTILDLHLLD